MLTAGTNGNVLTLEMLDELLDAVRGTPSLLLMNKTVRRKARQLARSVVHHHQHRPARPRAGRLAQVLPFGLIEEDETGADILGFDETQGTANRWSSIYAVRSALIPCINQTKPIEARDLGAVDDKPALRTRVEFYCGYVIKHPKAAARLKGVKAA
ncbi:hypothetical protein AB5I41_04615 [Sphingomonas sp. MMS24-JH45]